MHRRPDRLNRKQWQQTLLEREQTRRARRLAEGLGQLWGSDSEQALARALHEVIASR